jgi:hypothetical protein
LFESGDPVSQRALPDALADDLSPAASLLRCMRASRFQSPEFGKGRVERQPALVLLQFPDAKQAL